MNPKFGDLLMNDLLRSYEILGLKPGASFTEVQQAYRDAARVWHPDRFPHDPHLQEEAQARIREINGAYQQLKSHLSGNNGWACGATSPGRDEPISMTSNGREAPPEGETLPQVRTPGLWIRNHVAGLFLGLALVAGLLASPLIYAYLSKPSGPTLPSPKESVTPPASQAPLGDMASLQPAAPQAVPQTAPKVAPPAPAARRFFTLGATQDEVWALQGPPTTITGNTWKYGLSTVTFKNYRVISYSNISWNLKVRLVPKTPVTDRQFPVYFTKGSSKDRVLVVQGTPSEVVGNTWKFGESEVRFRGDRVVSYANLAHNLQVKGPAKTRAAGRGRPDYFTLGSSKRRVLAAQGFPSCAWGNTWWYGYSQINFYHNRVVSFADYHRNLKVRVF